MRTVVGVIGPADLVQRVETLASEFNEIEVLALPYKVETETPDLLARHESLMSIALCTGPVPYYLALGVAKRVPLVYVSLSGSSLYRTMLEMVLRGRELTHVSVDTVDAKAVRELMAGLGLDTANVRTFQYDGPVTQEALVNFHLKSKEHGATSALTCLRSAHTTLVSRGVDSWRVLPDEPAIREGLSRVVLEARAMRSRDAELVITLVSVSNFDEFVQGGGSEYTVQRVKLDLQRALLDYAERQEASLHAIGDEEFMLVSTRRAVETSTDNWTRSALLDMVSRRMPLRVSVGIGLGPTAAVAQSSARMALHYSQQRGGNCAHAVIDSKKVIGPMGQGSSLQYSLRTEDSLLRSIATKTGLSASTIDRLLSFSNSRSFEPVTAAELARALGVTARSGRRLISRLVACDLAEPVGEEQPYRRGRPRQTYRLKLRHFK